VPEADAEIPSFPEDAPEDAPVRKAYTSEELVERVIDTVVGISDEGQLYGSGVLVDGGGTVATNRHVVGTASKVKVQLGNGEEHLGELLVSYRDIDLAFLRMLRPSERFASLDVTPTTRVGETVFAIGHPFGLQNTITRGIISAVRREVAGNNYIQTDASINPGNSGGPLFNAYAEIVGINTMGLSQTQGLNFAIPLEVVRERYQRLQAVSDLDVVYCGICGKNSTHFRYCERCGVELNRNESLRPMNPRAEMVQLARMGPTCAACQTRAYPDDTYCEFCGATLGT